jgi:hypothetical protein
MDGHPNLGVSSHDVSQSVISNTPTSGDKSIDLKVDECESGGSHHENDFSSPADCCVAVCYGLGMMPTVVADAGRSLLPSTLLYKQQTLLAAELGRFLRPPRA